MPVIRESSARSRKRRHGFIGRLFHRRPPAIEPEPRRRDERTQTALVDANTRTFWSRGAYAPATLVDGNQAAQGSHSRRVAALVEAHENGTRLEQGGRPRANPAFTEALFVELMRAHQYQRAFGMLHRECRTAWGSADAFATAQGGGPMRRLRGVRVLEVRHLQEWTDTAHRRSFSHVAELDVEYTLGSDAGSAVVQRTVHLVSDSGRWWSLCYPG